jgi:RHS repeat-associated protein
MPARYPVLKAPFSSDPTQSLVTVCPARTKTGKVVESGRMGKNGPERLAQKVAFFPRVWFLDVNGDGIQDRLACNSNGQHADTTHLTILHGTNSADSVHIPDLFEDTSEPLLPAFSNMCSLFDDNNEAVSYQHSPPFSALLDVNGDGANDLVAADSTDHLSVLLFDANGVATWHDEYFSEVTIAPNKRDYVAIMDANGDGLRDLVALPDPKIDAHRTTARIAYNTGAGFVETPLSAAPGVPVTAPEFAPFIMDYDHDGYDDLIEPTPKDFEPWRLRRFKDHEITAETLPIFTGPGTMGDFDGDGNVDILTSGGNAGEFRLWSGRGRRDHLLKNVTDGMGRVIDIEYDSDADLGSSFPGLADTSQSWSSKWPVQVARERKPGNAVVTKQLEGHYTSQARDPNQFYQVDRQVDYGYRDWATDLAGYGPLGFSSRLVVERDGRGTELRRRLIELDVSAPVADGPYKRVFTGLARKVTELAATVAETDTTNAYSPRTDTSLDWEQGTSDAGLPFPYLHETTVQRGYDGVTLSDGNPPVPVNNLYVLAERTETNEVDGYGNMSHEDVSGTDVPHTTLDQDFAPTAADRADWLISIPHTRDLTGWPANCGDQCESGRRNRHADLAYYPHTNLLHTVHRAPGVPDQDQLVTLGRNSAGNIEQVVMADLDGDTREVDFTYDDRQLFRTSVTRVGGTSQTTKLRYDDRFGTLSVRVDPNGIDETWSYDDFGVLRLYHGPNGDGSTDYSSDDLHSSSTPAVAIFSNYKIVSTRAGGETTVGEYNVFGQPVRTMVTGLPGESCSPESAGGGTQPTTACPVFEEREYDWRNRLSRAYHPHLDGDDSQGSDIYVYDAQDRVTELLQERATTSNQSGLKLTHYYYGLTGEVKPAFPEMSGFSSTRVVPPDGAIVNRSYDAEGRLTLAYDSEGTDTTQSDVPAPTFYYYAAFGDLREIYTGENFPVLFELTRDDYGRVITRSQPYSGNQLAATTYNGLDEPRHTSDNGGRNRDIFYDDFGRLDHTIDDDGTTQWIYDVDQSAHNHDTIGRLVQTISPDGQVVNYDYMGAEAGRNRGLLSSVTKHLRATLPGGQPGPQVNLALDYSYDDFSRLYRVDYPAVAGSRFGVQYDFDSAGHAIAARQPADLRATDEPTAVYWQLLDSHQGVAIDRESLGDACGGGGVVTTRHFDDPTGQLDHIQSSCGETVIQKLTYEHDDFGKTTRRVDGAANHTETFGYDSVGRLQDVNGSLAYQYSDIHGFAWQAGIGSYTRQTQEGGAQPNYYWTYRAGENTYLHDTAGNQYDRRGPNVVGGIQSFTYTTFDLPRHVSRGDNYAVDFSYDANGTRAIKAAVVSGSPADTTFYLDDSFQRIEHADGTASNRNVIYAGGRMVAVATTSDTDPSHPVLHYLHADALGSIQTITDEAGTVEATRDFSALGVERNGAALFSEVPYGFTGQEHDDDLGLINMRGRIYDPQLAEFLSPDPFMPTPMGHGLNAFSYVSNQPFDFTDPTGFDPMIIDKAYGLTVTGPHPSSAIAATQGAATANTTPLPPSTVASQPATAFDTASFVDTTSQFASLIFTLIEICSRTTEDTHAQAINQTRSAQSAGSNKGKNPTNQLRPNAHEPSRTAVQTPPGNREWGPPPDLSRTQSAADATRSTGNSRLNSVDGKVDQSGEMWDSGAKGLLHIILAVVTAGTEEVGLEVVEEVVTEDVAAEGAVEGAATEAADVPATMIGQESGPSIVVPEGATGPTPALNGGGVRYTGGTGGPGLDQRVTEVRIMDPTKPAGPSPGYSSGYASYANKTGQAVNPATGQTLMKGDPWWHIPLKWLGF